MTNQPNEGTTAATGSNPPASQEPARHDRAWHPAPLERLRRAMGRFIGGSGKRSGARDTDPGGG